MFDIGFGELVFLGIIIIIVLGPDKLPEAIRYVSKFMLKLNRIKNDIKTTLDQELNLQQLHDELKDELSHVKKLEQQMQEYFLKLEQETQKNHFKFYPIEAYAEKVPFRSQFIIQHMMHWSCLSLKNGA